MDQTAICSEFKIRHADPSLPVLGRVALHPGKRSVLLDVSTGNHIHPSSLHLV